MQNSQAQSEFLAVALQSFGGISAILFGVFGFLYTVFVSLVSEKALFPKSAKQIKYICRFIAFINTINTAAAIYCMYAMNITTGHGFIISIMLGLILSLISLVCIYMAYWLM